MEHKKLFIAGGAGYIGSALIKHALLLDYHVICYDLLVYSDHPIIEFKKNNKFSFIKGDIRDKKLLNESLKGVDYVVNLAAIVGDKPCQAAPKSAYQINFIGNNYLLEIAKKNKVKKYVFASTCSNYGISDPNNYATEESLLNPVSLYAETKIDSEKILKEISDENFCTTSLRFGTAYGISNRTRFDLTINSFAYEAFSENKLVVFASNTWRPYIHVNDIVNITLKILDCNKKDINGEIFNAGFTNENYTKDHIVDIFLIKMSELKIIKIHTVEDFRNYRVSFKKIENLLKIQNLYNISLGIDDLLDSFKNKKLTYKDYSTNSLEKITEYFNNKEKSLIFNNI